MINDLKGGVGDSTVPASVDPNELSTGIQIEMEHTNNPSVAKEIAMDHLTEDPEYYSKLVKAGLAKEFQPATNTGFGDPDYAINDKSRAGNHGNKNGNVLGTIGNTPDGQVAGRNSDPIVNKTVDIELQEKKKPKPTNPSLWSRAKAMARAKFDVYPSAYANAWAAKWYKKKGGGWRMSEDYDTNKNPLNAFDGPAPAEVSPDGLGTYGSGYDFVGYAENKDKIMKEQKLKQIIKSIIRKQLNEQEEKSGENTSTDDTTTNTAGDTTGESETVTVKLDRDVAQKLHDMLMQQLTSKTPTETPSSTEPESSQQPETSETSPESSQSEVPPSSETPVTDSSKTKEPSLNESGKLKAVAEKGKKLGKKARLAMTLNKIAKKKKK